jgi:hypothetical protein
VMVDAYNDRKLNNQLASRALEYAHQHSWERKRSDYLTIVERPVNDRK